MSASVDGTPATPASPARARAAAVAEAAGAALLAGYVAVFALTLAAVYAGLGVGAGIAWLALPALPAAAYASLRADGRDASAAWLGATAIAGGVLAVSLALAARAFDHSWDGASYHQQAIVQLAEGWPEFPRRLPDGVMYADWLHYYAKAPWLVAAAVYRATGSLEAGMGLQFVLLAAGGLLLAAGLLRTRLPAGAALGIAALAALNPVALYQSLSFYVDGQIASLLVALAGLMLLLLERARRDRLCLLAAAIVVVVNLKHTGVAFGGLAVLALLAAVWRWRRTDLGRVFLAAAIGGVLGGGVFGFSPYVTNQLAYGHPFYPILGNPGFDIAEGQRPPGFAELDRFSRLARSTFSAPTTRIDEAPQWRLPLQVSRADIERIRGADIRLGGWGVLFGASLLLALAGLAWWPRLPPRARWSGGLLLGAIALSVAINPEAWWARYDPQWYFVPVVLAAMLLAGAARGARVHGAAVCLLLALNSVSVMAGYYPPQKRYDDYLRRFLAEQREHGGVLQVWLGRFPSNRVRLAAAGVPYQEVADAAQLRCAQPQRIFAHEGLFCVLGR